MAFPRVQFSKKKKKGEHVPGPPCIIRAFGADSPLVSPITSCLVFSYKNLHSNTKRIMIPGLNEAKIEHHRIQNET